MATTPHFSLLWYAKFNQGKTLLAGQLAEWVHRVTNGEMITRMYTADGGGIVSVGDKIREGKLEVWQLLDSKFRYESIDQVTRGWWGKETVDGISRGPLVAPTPETWDRVGARVYEGLTSFSQRMMDTLVERIEDGVIKVDPNATSKYDRPAAYFKDGSTWVADVPPGLYKLLFQRINKYVNQSEGLPGITAWTARELVPEPDEKLKVCGPELVGKKLTPDCPAWFEHVLHLDSEEKRRVVERGGRKVSEKYNEYRIYLKQHYDSDRPTTPYLCGLRLTSNTDPEAVPQFIEAKPLAGENPFDTIFPYIGVGGKDV